MSILTIDIQVVLGILGRNEWRDAVDFTHSLFERDKLLGSNEIGLVEENHVRERHLSLRLIHRAYRPWGIEFLYNAQLQGSQVQVSKIRNWRIIRTRKGKKKNEIP